MKLGAAPTAAQMTAQWGGYCSSQQLTPSPTLDDKLQTLGDLVSR